MEAVLITYLMINLFITLHLIALRSIGAKGI